MPAAFRTVLGEAFATLAPAVQRLHAITGTAVWSGCVVVRRGSGLLAGCCAWMAGLPPGMGESPLRVQLRCSKGVETWQRHFAGHAMHSQLRAVDGVLVEALGPLRFVFRLDALDGAIHWTVRSVRLFGVLPLPASWFAAVRCREYQRDGRYAFQVQAALPLLGEVIAYEGWLEPT
jgi:hypothetical protein